MSSKPSTGSRAKWKKKVTTRATTKRALSPNYAVFNGGAKKKPVFRAKEADENIIPKIATEQETDQTDPKVDVNFCEWLEKQGLSIEQLLTKTVKLGRPPATKQHQLKFNELVNVITELRAAAKYLLEQTKDYTEQLKKLEEERDLISETAEAQKTQYEAKIKNLRDEICQLKEQHREIKTYAEKLQSYNTDLQGDLTQMRNGLQVAEAEKRSALEELIVAKGQKTVLEEKLKEREEMNKSTVNVLESKIENLEKSKESDSTKIYQLNTNFQNTQKELQKTQKELQEWKTEAELYQAKTGKSAEDLEKIECKKAALEIQYESQSQALEDVRKEILVLKTQRELNEDQLNKAKSKITELQVEVETKDKEVDHLESKLQDAETERRKLHNTIQELKGNIRVFCRVRPALVEEETCEPGTSNPIITFPKSGDENNTSRLTCLCPPAPQQPYQKLTFSFDFVFSPVSTQEAVFEEISQLVQSALDGYKVCIFAYGQTGSGKTYTMLGDQKHRGVIPLSMDQVFSACGKLEQRGWKFAMHASMLEIYNEEYQDLLSGPNQGSKKHVVSHDAHGNTTVSDLLLVNVREPGKVEDLLSKALAKRSTGSTQLNDQSSRSHFVFTLKIEGRNFDTEQKVRGVLNLIDLAGSERIKESGAQGVRLKEAQNINKSLSSLGDVIMALSNKADHVPYRNSKLTWLLQPCLGKDSKTLMFVNISPSQAHCHESVCSLRFASKVNACEIGVAKRMMTHVNNKEQSIKEK